MTTGAAMLVLTVFLASAVEAVEALTVVLAVGSPEAGARPSSAPAQRPSPSAP